VNIKTMLVRLQDALEWNDLSEKIVLLPGAASISLDGTNSKEAINLVVGYDSSPNSQTALDLALWIAHQTRLVTRKPVTVKVVYVLEQNPSSIFSEGYYPKFDANSSNLICQGSTEFTQAPLSFGGSTCLIEQRPLSLLFNGASFQTDVFEQAERIFQQACSLADEWGGNLKTHLRCGSVSCELREFVEIEATDLLFLGCSSVNHPVIQKLGSDFPCPVLGIPNTLLVKQLTERTSELSA